MAITPDYILELTQKNDVEDVIGSYVQLKRRGRTRTGLCPFHNEKTPSFVVYPETQSFYCFGCGAGGDVITFIKQINNLDYIDSVKFLAARAGMPMPEDRDGKSEIKKRVYEINKDVARFYFNMLNTDEGMPARRYLRGRKLTDDTIRKFGLGFSPNSFNATKDYLLKKGYTENELLTAGIIRKSERGHTYDAFRNRVMFPIIDLRGNVIAFGGRNMGDEKPKYLNSGDTPVFKKSENLFALNLAKKHQSKRYILAEGYMDVISMHQAGFGTAVATLGTALTQEQAKIIAKYGDEIILSYDSDEAGQKATKRAIEIISREPVKVSVLNIDGAKDPDEFINKYGAKRFELLLSGSSNAIEYELAKAKINHDVMSNDGRLSYVRDAINILSESSVTPTQRDVYAGRISQETGIAKNAIVTQLETAIRQKMRKMQKKREENLLGEGIQSRVNFNTKGYVSPEKTGSVLAQHQLIVALLREPSFYKMIDGRVSYSDFTQVGLGNAFKVIQEKNSKGEYYDLSIISMDLDSETISEISRDLAKNFDVKIIEDDINRYVDNITAKKVDASNVAEKTAQELDEYIKNLRASL